MSEGVDVQELVRRAKEGDRESIDRLLTVLRPRMLEVASRYAEPGRVEESASDLVQEAWMRAWQKLEQFRGGESADETLAKLEGWVGRIVERLGLNAHRDRKARKRSPEGGRIVRLGGGGTGSSVEIRDRGLVADEPGPSSAFRADEEALLVQGALDRLADPLVRDIVRLHVVDGVPLTEIASRLRLTYRQARARYQRGMAELERELGGLG